MSMKTRIQALTASLFILTLVLSACASPAEPAVTVREVTREVPQTVVVTQVVTQMVTPQFTSTLPATSTLAATPTPTEIPIYYPLEDCAFSRIHVGDTVWVLYGGTPNGLRSSPDVHGVGNVVDYAEPGDQLTVIGGPECSYGWILWLVRTEDGLTQAWTPESDGQTFFLTP